MPYRVIREMGGEQTLRIADAEITLGRSRQNHVKLLTEQSSRHHCKLVKTDKGYRVVDGNSSNGTYVNGLRISEKDLGDGDAITVGNAAIRFHTGAPPKP